MVGRFYLDMHPREGKDKWFSRGPGGDGGARAVSAGGGADLQFSRWGMGTIRGCCNTTTW